MLACARVHIEVLDEGDVMNQDLYCELVEDHFERWAGPCQYLVQDFEGCLRTSASLDAIRKAGLTLVEDYPRSSQDFNAMENVWGLLRERLDVTLPRMRESRGQFIERLRAAVAWINRSQRDLLWYLATNQKERATDCLCCEPPGGRTKW